MITNKLYLKFKILYTICIIINFNIEYSHEVILNFIHSLSFYNVHVLYKFIYL